MQGWGWVVVAGCLSLGFGACSGNPSSPSGGVPTVEGTYSGPIDFRVNGALFVNGSGQMRVVQSGSQLTITGTVTFFNQTFAIPAVTGNINRTGFFTATGGGAAGAGIDPNCGLIETTSATLAFEGNAARYVETATTDFCGNWEFSGTLRR